MKKKQFSKYKVYRGLFIFCVVGTIVMLVPEDNTIHLGGVIFYVLASTLFYSLMRKHKNVHLKSDNILVSLNDFTLNQDSNDMDLHQNTAFENVLESNNYTNLQNHESYEIFVKTVLLDRFKNAGYIYKSNSQYPEYIINKFSIVSMYDKYFKYLKDGYLEVASDEKVLLTLLKPQLQSICQHLNISKSGNKPDLVDRIINTSNYRDITNPITGTAPMYTLSKIGLEFISLNEDLLRLNDMNHINPIRYLEIKEKLMETGIQSSYEQILIIILREYNEYHFKNNDYNNVKFTNQQIVNLYILSDNPMDALYYIIQSIIIELSGLSSFGHINTLYEITNNMKEYNRILSYNQIDIEKTAKIVQSELRLPFNKFDDEVSLSILLDYSSNGTVDFEKYIRFEKKSPYITEWGDYWKSPF